MPVLFLSVFRFVRLLLSGHQAVAIENAALRLQIAAFQRKQKRPLLTTLDREFWVTLRSVWSDWRHPLLYIQADTVVVGSANGSANSGSVVQPAAPASRSPRHGPRTPPVNRAN